MNYTTSLFYTKPTYQPKVCNIFKDQQAQSQSRDASPQKKQQLLTIKSILNQYEQDLYQEPYPKDVKNSRTTVIKLQPIDYTLNTPRKQVHLTIPTVSKSVHRTKNSKDLIYIKKKKVCQENEFEYLPHQLARLRRGHFKQWEQFQNEGNIKNQESHQINLSNFLKTKKKLLFDKTQLLFFENQHDYKANQSKNLQLPKQLYKRKVLYHNSGICQPAIPNYEMNDIKQWDYENLEDTLS